MNLENLVAIDIHTHAWKSALRVDDAPTESQEAMGRYFRYQPQHQTVPEMADYYRKLKMAFVVFTVDGPSERSEARGKITNEEIAELAHKHGDVAVDFPDMPIVIAHPSFPWQEEALSVATHKPQVYIDLSGWSPKYFPPILVQYANTLLKDKVLFGSDYPVMSPERWMADFEKLEIKPEVRPLIMKMNAARLLGLVA